MSLFKVRNFWNFDLAQLASQCVRNENEDGASLQASNESDETETSTNHEDSSLAMFAVELGQFDLIGPHDVFVCANLNGLIFIIQVPRELQLKQSIDSESLGQPKNTDRLEDKQNNDQDIASRQLLLAQQLGLPIVDIKCAFVTSCQRRSIVVLSFDKLIVYKLKRIYKDLISSSTKTTTTNPLQNDDLNFELEEQHRIDLVASQIALRIVTLDNHDSSTDSGLQKHEDKRTGKNSISSTASRKPSNEVNLPSSSLPSRDLIVVQYANQFIFSIFEAKKVIGHFMIYTKLKPECSPTSSEADEKPQSGTLLAQSTGSIPCAYLRGHDAQALVIGLSNFKIYRLSMRKLIHLANQAVVKRVAKNLLNRDVPNELSIGTGYDTSGEENRDFVQLNLAKEMDWAKEMIFCPINMIGAVKQHDMISECSTEQLVLIMSRYAVDLVSGLGYHLWSHRYEASLICTYPFQIPDSEKTENQNTGSVRLMSLICMDGLIDDKGELAVMNEDRIVWSASFNSHPSKIWRTDLSDMSSVLATFDLKQSLLGVSYLGTNFERSVEENADEDAGSLKLSSMESFDEPILTNRNQNSIELPESQGFRVDTQLNASNQWPDVCVKCIINILPAERSSSVFQNIVAILEFDDMINFDSGDQSWYALSPGVFQTSLGDCWPDRREPISIDGSFSLESTIEKVNDCRDILPKSLEVRLYIKYSTSSSGPVMQEDFFHLPLSIVARLAHIDYSSSHDQKLVDVQGNLSSYRRQNLDSLQAFDTEARRHPYYLYDLFVRTGDDLIDLMDEIIESDLICRGKNTERINYSVKQDSESTNEEKRTNTIENINLLAQSLDCRLKYRGLVRAKNPLERQTSDEVPSIVMISLALKVANCQKTICGLNVDSSECLVWLHFLDLDVHNSTVPEEIVRQHMEEWDCRDDGVVTDLGKVANASRNNVLVSIECEFPIPVLLLANHLTARLRRRIYTRAGIQLQLCEMNQSLYDSIDMDFNNIRQSICNFIAMSNNLKERLRMAKEEYERDVKEAFQSLKNELTTDFEKFHMCTKLSLSMIKKLSDLPEDALTHSKIVSDLTRKYQLKLTGTLSKLEKLEQLDYQFCKVPEHPSLFMNKQFRSTRATMLPRVRQ